VISRSIEPVKEAGTVGEENGYRLRPGMETYVLEHQQSKEPCRFQVSDLGNGFSKFIPHQNGKKIDACIVEKGESKKPTATTKPSPQGGKSEASR
jgi:hypothetical protein